jgi:adenylate kinase
MRVFALIGAPGSGKGTQSRFVARRHKAPVVGMGDLLRQEIERGSAIGEGIKEVVEKGDFPTTELVMGILWRHLASLNAEVVLFDGVPRSVEQAEQVDSMLERLSDMLLERRAYVEKAIYLNVPLGALKDRILRRYMCKTCNAVYAEGLKEPKVKAVCDFCLATEFTRRVDDQADILEDRLMRYQQRVEPLLAYYEKRNLLHVVDAQGHIDDISEAVSSVITGEDSL